MGGIALSRLLRPFLWVVWLALLSLVLPALLAAITPIMLLVWLVGLIGAIASPPDSGKKSASRRWVTCMTDL